MTFKIFCSTQEQLAINLKNIIDSYFDEEIDNDILIKNIKDIIALNEEKFYNKEKTEIALKIRQKVGKKRLDIILKILNHEVNA